MGTSHAAGWGPDSPTPAQLKEFFDQVTSGSMTKARMQAIIRGAGRWDQISPPPRELLLQDWEIFYDVYFGLRVDFTGLRVPPHKPDYDRVIVIAEGLTLQSVSEVCTRFFPCEWCVSAHDASIPRNERSPQRAAYAIRIRESREPDPDMGWVSIGAIESGGIATMTFLERLVYELKYYTETGDNLDVEDVTLCSGSRDGLGWVPTVNWEKGGMDQYKKEIPAKLLIRGTGDERASRTTRPRLVAT